MLDQESCITPFKLRMDKTNKTLLWIEITSIHIVIHITIIVTTHINARDLTSDTVLIGLWSPEHRLLSIHNSLLHIMSIIQSWSLFWMNPFTNNPHETFMGRDVYASSRKWLFKLLTTDFKSILLLININRGGTR